MNSNASASSNLQLAIVRNPLIVSPQTPVAEAIAQMTQLQNENTQSHPLCPSTDAIGELNLSVNLTPDQLQTHTDTRSRCVLVVEQHRWVGLLSDRDIMRLTTHNCPLHQLPISEVMSSAAPIHVSAFRSDALSCADQVAQLGHALLIQMQPHAPYLPVVNDEGCPVGLISRESLLHALDPVALYYQSHTQQQALHQLTAENCCLQKAQISNLAIATQTEAALVQSETQSQAILRVIPDLMFCFSREGVYLGRVSAHAAIDFFAHGQFSDSQNPENDQPLVGQHILDLMPEENAKRHLHYIQNALETGEVQIYEQQIQAGDRLRHEEVRIVKSGENQVLFMVRDSTERKRALEALRQSEQTNRVIVESIPDLLIQMDRNGRRIFLGGDATSSSKWLPNTSTATDIREMLPPKLVEIRLRQAQQAIATGKLQVHEQTVEIDGETHYEEVRIAPLSDENVLVIIRNITARKQAEQQLHQLNQDLEAQIAARTQELTQISSLQRAILNSTDYAIISTDSNHVIHSFNASAQRMLGYAAEEVMGQMTLDQFHDPDEVQQRTATASATLGRPITTLPELFVAYMGDGLSPADDWIYLRHDGSRIPVSLSITALRDADNHLLGFVILAKDMSQHRHAEAQLHILSDRLNLAVQSAKMGIWDWHVESDRLIWDERMYELFRAEASDDIRTKEDCLRRIHPDDAAYIRDRIEQAMQHEQEYDVQFRVILPNGSIRHIQSHAMVQRDAADKVQRIIGTNMDITHRKHTEERLRVVGERLKLAVKSAQLGIWDWDIAGDRLFWDERMYELYGVEAASSIGAKKDCLQKIHPDDASRTQQLIQQAIQGECEYDVEFRVILPDGSIRYIQSYAIVQRNAAGEAQRAIGTNMDISERKQAELRLSKANQQLIRATRMKDDFLANMSHELRTPLNAILGMAEALQEEIYGTLNLQQSSALHTIERSGNHLLELINDILDLAKIEAGHIKLHRIETDIGQLCQSSVDFVKQQADKKQIRLNTQLGPNLPHLWIDERRIRQVLLNLLTNAVKFTPEGGSVTLSVSVSEKIKASGDSLNRYSNDSPKDSASKSAPDPIFNAPAAAASSFGATSANSPISWVHVSVIDTGIGIAPNDLENLFQPFVQVDSALNRQYDGTGLGLALVKHIVEMHEGAVSVSSIKGQGSCFSFRLPCIVAAQQHEFSQSPDLVDRVDLPAQPPPPTRSSTILLVEDNEVNIATLRAYLVAKGYTVLVARDGQIAIDITASKPIDLILMDIQMPRLDGIQAIRHIRNSLGLTQLPIIALTALAMAGDRDRCLNAGANEYFTKPVKLKQLTSTIETLLQR